VNANLAMSIYLGVTHADFIKPVKPKSGDMV